MDEPIAKIINSEIDIKIGHSKQEKLDVVQRKIKNRKASSLDEIPLEVWKKKKFDDILLRYRTPYITRI